VKYKILKSDPLNWTVEEHIFGGGIVAKGKYSGQIQKESWKVIGYFNSPQDAIKYVLKRCVGDEFNLTNNLLEAITKAETNILNNLNELMQPK